MSFVYDSNLSLRNSTVINITHAPQPNLSVPNMSRASGCAAVWSRQSTPDDEDHSFSEVQSTKFGKLSLKRTNLNSSFCLVLAEVLKSVVALLIKIPMSDLWLIVQNKDVT